ncbi:MAG: hypothetical protein ABS949_17960 [Solibacillus sp.]
MSFKSMEEMLAALAAYGKQVENEEAIREAMNSILAQGEYEEEDLPQNGNLRAAVQSLVDTNPRIFSALDDLGVDYIESAGFKCFKADNEHTGVESIYFISPILTLSLDDSYL